MIIIENIGKYTYREAEKCAYCAFTKYEVNVKYCIEEQCSNIILKEEYKKLKGKIRTAYIKEIDEENKKRFEKLKKDGNIVESEEGGNKEELEKILVKGEEKNG